MQEWACIVTPLVVRISCGNRARSSMGSVQLHVGQSMSGKPPQHPLDLVQASWAPCGGLGGWFHSQATDVAAPIAGLIGIGYVTLAIRKHWFTYWLGDKQVINNYLNKRWLNSTTHYGVTRPHQRDLICLFIWSFFGHTQLIRSHFGYPLSCAHAIS